MGLEIVFISLSIFANYESPHRCSPKMEPMFCDFLFVSSLRWSIVLLPLSDTTGTFWILFALNCLWLDFQTSIVFNDQQDNMCIVLNWSFAIVIAIVRSVTDFVYLLHMLLQVTIAYLFLSFKPLILK